MSFDFDRIYDRHNTYSTQWDYAQDRFGSSDVVPFSISDSDFAVPDAILNTLRARLDHPIFGYTRWNHSDYKQSVVSWFAKRGGATVDPNWIVYSPSVIFSVATLIRLHSQPGDYVATFTPMYDAFFEVIQGNGRRLLPVSLSGANKSYALDWASLEAACSNPMCKVLLLTNPHNPTGKVFTKDELERIALIAKATHTFVISDDIHRDIVYSPNAYLPITEVMQDGCALLCSATKTFNIAGLGGSYALVPAADLRQAFSYEMKQRNAVSSANIMGMYAQMVAYNECEDYVDELVAYLYNNMTLIKDFLAKELPAIRFEIPQGTYLAWMDVSELNVAADALQHTLVHTGHVGIMNGAAYGDEHYLRMCVACPRTKVQTGLAGLKTGVQSL